MKNQSSEWLYGNLTAQAASNLNLSDFDNYVVKKLGLNQYVRYVDDIVIVSNNKKYLIDCLPLIKQKLAITNQKISNKKTKIDTAYHGVSFLGKVSYPYGYQKPNKQVIKRVCQKSKKIEFEDRENLLAKTNSQIGTLKKYNCRKLIKSYIDFLPQKAKDIVQFDYSKNKFY